MKLRYEKSMRVLTDIMGYCHLIGCQDFNVDFVMRDRETEITVRAKMDNIPDEVVEKLDRILNIPRQREVEQYYWNIGGEEEIDDELPLAGMMIDKAVITRENGTLVINALRYDATNED